MARSNGLALDDSPADSPATTAACCRLRAATTVKYQWITFCRQTALTREGDGKAIVPSSEAAID